VVPKPLDQKGIVIARSPKEKQPKMIHVTPSHQYPLGMTMSFERRTALLDFARAHNAFIFEDDFYAEFRFTGPPLPCLQGMDNFSRVIYAGTMSKILYPSLRLGYLVAPEQLIDPLVKIRSTMDQHSSAIDQATLARFITEGFFLSHLKQMRKLYAERREFFITEFNRLLSDRFLLQIPQESCVSVPRSESSPHRYHFIASRRSSNQRLFSVLLPGRPRKFEKASSGSHLHLGNKEILVFNSDQ
jgi:GntR family transcriptional regulator/MocR family aminotransferase